MRARLISMSVLAASLLAAGGVMAQPNGSFTFGGQWWTQDVAEAKYQEYRVIPRGGFLEDFVLRENFGGWTGAMWGKSALRADQHNSLMLAKGVTFRVDAEYNGIPHLYSQSARSAFAQVSPGVFVLSDSLQRIMQNGTASPAAIYTAALRSLLAGATPVPLSLQTDVSKLRLRARPAKGWQFEASATERQRSGSLAMGTAFGIGSATMTEVASPINQRMLDADATGVWTHGRTRILGSVGMSQFTNRVSTLRVDNSRRLTDSATSGTAVAQLDMWPDNRVIRGRFSVSHDLPYSSTFTGTVGVSQGAQDDDLLPYTSNRALAQSSLDSLPTKQADEKFTQTVYDLRLTGRPTGRLYGTLRYRAEDYEKTSTQFLFQGFSGYDAGFTRRAEDNILWGSTRGILGLDLDYTLTDWASLALLGEHRTREHHHREVEKDGENVFGATLRLQPTSSIDFSAGWKRGTRELDEILLHDYMSGDTAFIEPSGLRRFDVADRKQTVMNANASWAVSEKLDLSATWNSTLDDYDNSVYGLQRSDNQMAFGEAAFHATKRLDLSGGYGFGQVLTRQASSELSASIRRDTSSTMDWWLNERDRNVFVFVHADWWLKPGKVVCRADYTLTRAMGEYHLSNTTVVRNGSRRAAAADVPSTFTRSHDLMLETRWMHSKSLDLGVRYDYMEFRLDDFAVQNVPLLGGSTSAGVFTPNAIYLGDSYRSYKAHRLAGVVSKRF